MYPTAQAIAGQRTKLFIGGEWADPHSGRYLDSYDPATGDPWYEAADADAEDVDRAVQAATRALRDPAWRRLTQTDRGRLIRRLADLVAGSRGGIGGDRDPRQRQAAQGDARADARHARHLSLLRRHGRQASGRRRSRSTSRHRSNFKLREPVGVVGHDHAVELAADAARRHAGAMPGDRQHRGHQAVRARLRLGARLASSLSTRRASRLAWSMS